MGYLTCSYTYTAVGHGGKESRVYRKPLGVIGIISLWNFPVHLSMRFIAPTLDCGNAIVVKPASQTPATGGPLLAKLLEEASLPGCVFNVVVGRSKPSCCKPPWARKRKPTSYSTS